MLVSVMRHDNHFAENSARKDVSRNAGQEEVYVRWQSIWVVPASIVGARHDCESDATFSTLLEGLSARRSRLCAELIQSRSRDLGSAMRTSESDLVFERNQVDPSK